MKTILLIILACICTHVYAQPIEALKPGSTKFSPINEKIKKISSINSLSKMKPHTGFILSSGKMSASNNWNLSFAGPQFVTYQLVRFSANDGSRLYNPALKAFFPANMGGVYVFEVNVALHNRVTDFNFQITCAGVTQVISLTNNNTNNGQYFDNKLVFAVTIPNYASAVDISSNSADWEFRNCEITPMK